MATTATPALQIAQILADLSDLNVADPDAAQSLTTAHKNLDSKLSSSSTPSHRRANSAQILKRQLSDQARETSMRLRFMTPVNDRSSSGSPQSSTGLSRAASHNMSNSGVAGLSRQGSYDEELEPDLARSSKLLRLFESRGRSKQEETNGLIHARNMVESVRVRYTGLV